VRLTPRLRFVTKLISVLIFIPKIGVEIVWPIRFVILSSGTPEIRLK